jgi:hypothetical protein
MKTHLGVHGWPLCNNGWAHANMADCSKCNSILERLVVAALRVVKHRETKQGELELDYLASLLAKTKLSLDEEEELSGGNH